MLDTTKAASWDHRDTYASAATQTAVSVLGLLLASPEGGPHANCFLSPVSLHLALTTMANASEGETRRQLLAIMNLENNEDLDTINQETKNVVDLICAADMPAARLLLANSFWLTALASLNLRAVVESKNAAWMFHYSREAHTVNEWIAKRTAGKITKVLTRDISGSTAVSVVHFKGQWAQRFTKESSRLAPFYLSDGLVSECTLVCRSGTFSYCEIGGMQCVELPFGMAGWPSSEFTALAILSHPSMTSAQLLASLPYAMPQIAQSLAPRPGTLQLPKFRVETTNSFAPFMRKLGCELAFDSEKAEFTKLIENGKEEIDKETGKPINPYIADMVQKVVLEVFDESSVGVATSAPSNLGSASSSMIGQFMMRCDRSFLFAVRHRGSNMLIITGIVNSPGGPPSPLGTPVSSTLSTPTSFNFAQTFLPFTSRPSVDVIHEGVFCDGCGATPLRGVRYRCLVCPDIDFCETCESTGKTVHFHGENRENHLLIKVLDSDDAGAKNNWFLRNRTILRHERHTCTYCKECPIVGTRLHCDTCNVDWCFACDVACRHPFDHVTTRIIFPV